MIFQKKGFNKTYLVALFFLILSIFLILVWFKEGHFYGGGDVGLPTYNPIRIFQIARYVWWEAIAPGFLIPHVITSTTLYFFLAFFQLIGIGPVGIQGILFFTLLFLMGFGMYLLTLSIIGKDKKIYATIAGLFYIFNPYMMTQIWHRFGHTSFLFVASIPFLILFWKLWIKSGNYLNLLYFLLVNLLASYMFGTIAFVVPFWLILSLFTISEIFLPWENKSLSLKVLGRSLFGLSIWILFNSWWLMPVATIGSGIASQQHDIGESLFTLVAISKQAIIPFSLQMVNSYYVFVQAELGEIYKSFFFRLIPWLGVITIFYGIVYALRRKYLAAFVIIYLVIIILSKGTSSPFGQPFLLLFGKFFALGLLRNPFEKIGILLPLVSSILFVAGIEGFFRWSGKNLGNSGKKIILIILLTIMGVYYWPMYQGKIFGKINQPNYVEIPQSYKDADEWLSARVHQDSKIDGKTLHLPLTRSDIATYKWKYGYHGIESSASLFTTLPSISHGFNLKRVDDSLTALSLIFHIPHSLHQEKVLKLLQDFNVRFIILHKDIEWRGSDIYDPLETEKVLDDLKFLEKRIEFGDLTIYEVKLDHYKPKIFVTDKISLVYPSDNGMFWPWVIDSDNTMITPMDQKIDDEIFKLANQILIFPQTSFSYPEGSSSALLATVNQIITDESTANSLSLPFKRVKPILIQNGELQSEKLNEKLISVSEELVKMLRLYSGIENYRSLLNHIFSASLRDSRLLAYINEKDISLIFQVHLSALAALAGRTDPATKDELIKVYDFLKDQLIKNNFIPQNPTDLGMEQKIFKFQIPKALQYEILMTDTAGRDMFQDKLEKIRLNINGEITNLSGQDRDGFMLYSAKNLEAGLVEIGYTISHSANLAQPIEQMVKSGNVTVLDEAIQLTPQGQFGHIESLLPNAKGGDIYKIGFEAMAKSGNGFYFQLVQDTDGFDQNNQGVYQLNEFINLSDQNNWQTFNFTLLPLRLATQQAAIRFVVAYHQPMSTPPSILIRNLRIEKVLNSGIVLKTTLPQLEGDSGGELVNTERENPVFYRGKVKVKQGAFLIFSETFHPGWKLTLKNNEGVYIPQKHFLANLYGNGWLIDKEGEYDFKIEFEPQKIVNYGAIAALLSFVSLLAYVIWKNIVRRNRSDEKV